VSKKQTSEDTTPQRLPIHELDGYDMVTSHSLAAGSGLEFQKEHQCTNTSGDYAISQDGEKVGHAALGFYLRQQEVSFDIAISKQGHDLGMTALKGLASNLDERGFSLVTGGIMPDSRSYWEHMAKRGDVTAIEPTYPQTQYRVLPARPPELAVK